jgi:DtxR family Mn-dependent transcriptional regulator
MLKKMAEMGLVIYETRKGIKFTKNGKKKAMNIIRNRRLAELLLTEVLNMEIDDEAICGFEHHISREIADAICKLLNHPRFCPHKNEIPKGKCCF